MAMRQLTLDIGMPPLPSVRNFLAGPNAQALQHLRLWLGDGAGVVVNRSPVPTYFWGPEASGKTHLLRAAQIALHEQGATCGWLDSSVHQVPDYDDRWAAVLMDDVHRYSASQQHMAFTWFVQAQSAQRAVLAAGTLAPAALTLREDLRTRLGWGHVFALQVLDEPERRAVLRQAADDRGIFLGDEVMDYMLRRFARDLSSLLQLLDALDAYSLQTQRPITIPLIKSMLEHT